MSKQTVNIGTSANDGTGDPLRTAFDKTNDNFVELYNALGGNDIVNLINNDEEIELLSTANKISFLYNTEAQLFDVDPTSHHGCIAHAHDTGALYYAHQGEWRKVLTDNANTSSPVPSYTDPLARHSYGEAITGSETDGYILQTNADGTYQWAAPGDVTGAVRNISELDDVVLINLNVGQTLKWNGSNWINDADLTGSGGSASFTGLTDTPASLGSAGQFIRVNSSGNALEFTAAPSGGGASALNDLSDVSTAGASSGQVLKYNGSSWAPATDATGSGGGAATRNTQAVSTASIADGAVGNISFSNLGKSYVLLSVQVSGAAWVRIYTDDAARSADSSRAQGDDPADGDGVVAEMISTGADTFKIAPGVIGWTDGQTTIPVAVRNNTGSTGTVTVTITALTLET